jgi:anti-sigma-K factor RskA
MTTPAAPALAVRPQQPTPSKRLLRLAAAAVVAVVAGLAAITIRQQDQIADLQAHHRRILQVVTAADAQTATQAVATGGTGTVVSSPSQGKMVFTTAGLAPLPPSQDYELWFMGAGDPRPAGLIDASGEPLLISLGGATQIGVTVEPKGGSEQPTSEPIFAVDVQV